MTIVLYFIVIISLYCHLFYLLPVTVKSYISEEYLFVVALNVGYLKRFYGL